MPPLSISAESWQSATTSSEARKSCSSEETEGVTSERKTGLWTRRRLLCSAPAALAPALISGGLRAAVPAQKSATPFSRFVDVAQAAGLTQPIVYGEPDSFTYIVESMATGCAFFDYDNDGWMDIFILGGRTLAGTPPGSGNRLYHNNRDGTFTDVTAKSGLSDPGWAQGVCVGDYNNDGWEDLFLTYYGQNRLYRNNGDGTFTNVTAEAGLLYPKARYSAGCTFVDYNRDGHLDLFVSNYLEIDLATAPKPSLDVPNCNYEGVAINCGPLGLPKAQHYLYRNNGDGTFTDVSQRVRHRRPARFLRSDRSQLSTPTRTAGPTSSWPATCHPRCC